MTDKTAPKRPDSCPSCGSQKTATHLTVGRTGLLCLDTWHSTAARTCPEFNCFRDPNGGIIWHTPPCPKASELTEPAPLTAEENQDDGRAVQGNQKYIDGTRVPTGSDYRTPNRSDSEVAPPLTEAPQPQHPNPFCNFWNGPIGGPGCICTGNVSEITAAPQTIYSCRHGASSQSCQICKGVAEFVGWDESLRTEFEKEAAMYRLDISRKSDYLGNYVSGTTRIAYIMFQNGYHLAAKIPAQPVLTDSQAQGTRYFCGICGGTSEPCTHQRELAHAQGTTPTTEHVCKPSCHNPCLLDDDEKGKWRRPIGYVLTPFGEKIEREMCEYFGFPSPPTKVDGIVLEAIWHKLALLWPTAQPSAPSVSEPNTKSQPIPPQSKAPEPGGRR
jgi:hypothetical protein